MFLLSVLCGTKNIISSSLYCTHSAADCILNSLVTAVFGNTLYSYLAGILEVGGRRVHYPLAILRTHCCTQNNFLKFLKVLSFTLQCGENNGNE
jgi:hypothetical protein